MGKGDIGERSVPLESQELYLSNGNYQEKWNSEIMSRWSVGLRTGLKEDEYIEGGVRNDEYWS